MPLYRDSSIGTQFQTLQDFPPTGSESLGAAVSSAWESNPSVLGYEAVQVGLANRGERLTAYDANTIAKGAGDTAFASGDAQYTREALDIILERRREQRVRDDVASHTPWSWTGTPVRGAAMLAANLLDPLNIASAYVPVIQPARYTALLAGAAGLGERTMIRAGVGAAQGAVGMGILEPGLYAAHSYMADDYTMRDSLINVAFGGLFGGGLHAAAGAIGDVLRPGQWAKPRALSDVPTGGPVPELARTGAEVPRPGSAAAISTTASPEERNAAMRVSLAQSAQGQTVNVEPIISEDRVAPQFDISQFPSEDFQRGRVTTIGGLLQGDPAWRERFDLSSSVDVWINPELPGLGATLLRDLTEGQRAAGVPIVDRIEINPANVMAQANLSGILYERELNGVLMHEAVHAERALKGRPMIGLGRTIAENSADRAQSFARDDVRAAAERQYAPESLATGDVPASRAADEQIAAAPKGPAEVEAEARAAKATADYQVAFKNLAASGFDPKRLAEFDTIMASFDAAGKDAEALGKAAEAIAICGERIA